MTCAVCDTSREFTMQVRVWIHWWITVTADDRFVKSSNIQVSRWTSQLTKNNFCSKKSVLCQICQYFCIYLELQLTRICLVILEATVHQTVFSATTVWTDINWFSICYLPTEGDGRLCFRPRWQLYRYVCEQLPGANSSPIVTKLGQSYPWPQGTINFCKVKVKGQGRWGGMRSTEPFYR